jgi:hypothetical protein
MSMVGFPLLLIPLAIYNIVVFLMPGVSLAEPLVTLPLTSGAGWPVTLSDVLLTLGILMLLLELIKGARPGAKYLTDHLLSLIVFGGAVAEFLLWPRFANSTYFLLVLLALVDFLSGLALHVRRAPAIVGASPSPRQVAAEVGHEPVDVHPVQQPPPANEPVVPAPSKPTFTHREPTFAHPEPTAAAPTSEAPSAEVSPAEAPSSEAPSAKVPSAEVSPAEVSPAEAPSAGSPPGSGSPPPPEAAR